MSQFQEQFKAAAVSQVMIYYKVKAATIAETQALVADLLNRKKYIYPGCEK